MRSVPTLLTVTHRIRPAPGSLRRQLSSRAPTDHSPMHCEPLTLRLDDFGVALPSAKARWQRSKSDASPTEARSSPAARHAWMSASLSPWQTRHEGTRAPVRLAGRHPERNR